jgi:hypothetical protein
VARRRDDGNTTIRSSAALQLMKESTLLPLPNPHRSEISAFEFGRFFSSYFSFLLPFGFFKARAG